MTGPAAPFPPDPAGLLQELLHRSANDTSVLVALADLAERDPARLPELAREIRRRCPALTDALRCAARSGLTARPGAGAD
mgnify:CR=1 FL=1